MKKKKINLDISKINSKAEINKFDFGWYDLNTIKLFREDLLKNIIPIIKINKLNKKINPSLILSVNIFSKWFFAGMFELFASLQTKKFLKSKFNEIQTPKKFVFLKKILNDDLPSTLFQNLRNQELDQNKLLRFLKNSIRTIQLNSIKDFIKFKRKEDVVLYTKFLKKNIRGNGKLNVLRDLKYFFNYKKNHHFGFFHDEKNEYSNEDLRQFFLIKKLVISSFVKFNIKLTKNNIIYIDNFIHHCFLFLRYNWINRNIPKVLHIGTGGSLPWGKLLCALVILNGGKVINYEHGRGTILHFFVQKFFTDLNFSSKFITINKRHMIINRKRYNNLKSKYQLHNFNVNISCPQRKISNPFDIKKKKFEHIKTDKIKALYVGSPFFGYSASFRPFLPDIHYLKFQSQIFNLLERKKIDFFLKSHPGGKSYLPVDITKIHQFNNLNDKYENNVDKIDFDFFILDHIASSTAPHIINYSKPTIYFDFNFTEINKLIIKEFNNSIKTIPVNQDNKGNFIFDNNLFDKFINNIRCNNHTNWKREITKFYD